MNHLKIMLSGGDLRSTGRSGTVAEKIKSKKGFDSLFALLFEKNRIIVMRAADAVEKITLIHPEYLNSHKKEILKLFTIAQNKELKWHLAQLVSRLSLSKNEIISVIQLLKTWLLNEHESRIVRVNALQALADLMPPDEFHAIISRKELQHIPSIRARIKKITGK